MTYMAAVLAFMALRGPGPGPFFRFSDGKPLTRSRLVVKLKESIQAAGVNCTAYSGHSFRSGAATTAARQGIGNATIKMLAAGKAVRTSCTLRCPESNLQQSQGPWPVLHQTHLSLEFHRSYTVNYLYALCLGCGSKVHT